MAHLFMHVSRVLHLHHSHGVLHEVAVEYSGIVHAQCFHLRPALLHFFGDAIYILKTGDDIGNIFGFHKFELEIFPLAILQNAVVAGVFITMGKLFAHPLGTDGVKHHVPVSRVHAL